jgi:hypothetical protein
MILIQEIPENREPSGAGARYRPAGEKSPGIGMLRMVEKILNGS